MPSSCGLAYAVIFVGALLAATTGVVAASVISSFSPTSGLEPGGAVVTITGKSFTGATAVAFGSVAATKFTVTSDTSITAISPVLDAGTYQLAVTTVAGTTTAGSFVVRSYADEVLRLVNDARDTKRKCGSTTYKAVPALRSSAKLAKVATAHSKDMAAHNFFSHSSRNGDSPFDRMADAGYKYSSAGENIAAGYASVTTVVQGWLDSPGHCTTLMGANYQDFGASCRYQAGSTYRYYWTTDFGRR